MFAMSHSQCTVTLAMTMRRMLMALHSAKIRCLSDGACSVDAMILQHRLKRCMLVYVYNNCMLMHVYGLMPLEPNNASHVVVT